MADEDPKLLAPETGLVDPTQTGEASEPASLEVGQWYWVNDEEKPWFGCIVHLGTNYAEVESPRRGTTRIHFDNFDETCKFEPNPDKIIEDRIVQYRQEVALLLGRVKEVTAQLAIAPSPMLNGAASETQALALRHKDQPDMKAYGAALTLAKEKTLPDLFKDIERANEAMAVWMTAKVVPLKARAKGLQTVIGRINDRIFSVELYAGLTEKVERIKEGEPAALSEKIRLFQRRCYMDEECLARYETGGMEFKDIGDFDAWLTRPENLDRLLPFPRCIVAFRVRRNEKFREIVDLISLFQAITGDEAAADKITFLYIRNGEQVFRMNTAIDFGEKLFPDLDRSQLSGKLWATEFAGQIRDLISDNEHTGILEERALRKKEWKVKVAEWKVKNAAYEAALKTPAAKAKAKARGLKKPDAKCVDVPYPGSEPWYHDSYDRYVPYDKSSVYYDDISKKIERQIQKHNRIALILQGLLDRSPVLHPHPPWQIWTGEGFQMALDLIHDDSRALVAGDKPDFEAYRAILNASLKVGSVTVGQDDLWARDEAKKEVERRDRRSRTYNSFNPSHVRPYGNPGPGMLAKLVEYSKSTGRCGWAWFRKRQTYPYDEPLRTTFAVNRKRILNVDAYTPGDFRTFFDDPRTRQEYLKWAPLLLEAEEYHAGNRKVAEGAPPTPKKPSSWEGQKRYEQQKRRKYMLGKAVRLTDEITTKGGHKYEVGSLWRVTSAESGKFSISGINPDGTDEKEPDYNKRRFVRGVGHYDLKVDLTIPGEPKEEKKPRVPKPEDEDDDSGSSSDPPDRTEDDEDPEEDDPEPDFSGDDTDEEDEDNEA